MTQPASQTQSASQGTGSATSANALGVNYLKNLALDQRSFWTLPAHIERKQMKAIIPIVAISAGLFASDADFSSQLSRSPTRINTSNNIANLGVAAMVASGGGMYLYGHFGESQHARESGVLSSEAAINSVIISELIKLATQRQRPNEGSGQGRFWTNGSSFPSQHAAVAWSLAAVFANEYPTPGMKFLSYGAASAISISRITSLNHFPSDVFLGSTLGYLIGHEVYRTRHDAELPGASYGTFVKAYSGEPGPSLTGTTFVPMDSWVYPLMDRLAAMGYMDSAFEGQRPWTRQECARLIKESSLRLQDQSDMSSSANSAYKQLQLEFAPELNNEINTDFDSRLESTYVGTLGISGQPLTDGYDFGETIVNNFGRPFGEGFNSVTGISTRFVAGPFGAYIRGEYQHAAAPMNLTPATQQSILAQDVPYAPPGSPWMVPPPTAVDRVAILDAYLSLNIKNNLVTFGKQSLWWGPSQGGPFLFSTNAQPISMFRLSRNIPYAIPLISRLLGPVDVQAFLGQLNGYQYVSYFANGQLTPVGPPVSPHPWIHGEKFTFKPTPNFEFGFGETTIFGGPGYGFNGRIFLRSYSSNNTFPGENKDPGDRRSAVDFNYRVPGLRHWLSFYADSFAEDEFSPIAYERRSAWWLGFYMPKLPKLDKLQLRAEGGYTDLPGLQGTGVYYGNQHYNSGYTNSGQILGNWTGRQGRGIQGWATYSFSARNTLQVSFRKQAANPDFLGGGTLYDGRAAATYMVKPSLELSGYLQYERWHFPLLSSTTQSNVAVAVQLNFAPLGGMTAGSLARAFKH